MSHSIADKLTSLRTDLQTGERLMAELRMRQSSLHEQLLRISGAIAVLEELTAGEHLGDNVHRLERPALAGGDSARGLTVG